MKKKKLRVNISEIIYKIVIGENNGDYLDSGSSGEGFGGDSGVGMIGERERERERESEETKNANPRCLKEQLQSFTILQSNCCWTDAASVAAIEV